MPQTLLALVAIMVTSLFVLVYQRTVVDAYRGMVSDEMETMAVGVGQAFFERLYAYPFDAQTANGTVQPGNPNPALLTPASQFGGASDMSECEDLDDFHGLSVEEVYRDDELEVPFTLEVRVRYVEPDQPDQEAAGQTLVKAVTITLQHPQLQRPVTLTRLYRYP